MSPRSLQNRLLLSFFVCMAAIFAGGSFVIYKMIARHLSRENDRLLEERMSFYEYTWFVKNLRGVQPVAATTLQPSERTLEEWEKTYKADNPDYWQAWYAADGKFITRSPSLMVETPKGSKPLPSHDLPKGDMAGKETLIQDHTLWDGRRARMISKTFLVTVKETPDLPDVPVRMVIALELKPLEEALTKMRWILLNVGLAVMGVMLVASRIIIRHGVRPVKSLANQIEFIPLTEAGTRFGLPGAPTELQPVVGRLNALMDRVGIAIDHERQFASNAAHELRNPLAAIRGTIEVALSRNRSGEEYEEALESIWQSQQGMQRIVDHLLLLARLESGHTIHEFMTDTALLGRTLKKAWRNCIDLAEEKKLRVVWQVEDPETEMRVAVSLFEIVFTNLLENAVAYTPSAGEIRIRASIREGLCSVAVENTNPGLSATVLEQTFSPFWRADPNASGHRGNAGIGLALCRRIAMTLGGDIRGTLTPEGMVCYAAELPVITTAPEVKPKIATTPVA